MPENLLLCTPLPVSHSNFMPVDLKGQPHGTAAPHASPGPPLLLGRFVLRPLSPLDNYCPATIPYATEATSTQVDVTTFETLIAKFYSEPSISINTSQRVTGTTSTSTLGKLGAWLGLKRISMSKTNATINTNVLTTWSLEQHSLLFKSLLSGVPHLKQDLISLAKEGRTDRVFWVIGLKTVKGPSSINKAFETTAQWSTHGTVPIGEVVDLHGLRTNIGDPELLCTHTRTEASDFSGTLKTDNPEDEYIVSVRCVNVRVRRFTQLGDKPPQRTYENLGAELLRRKLVLGNVIDFGGRKGHFSFGPGAGNEDDSDVEKEDEDVDNVMHDMDTYEDDAEIYFDLEDEE